MIPFSCPTYTAADKDAWLSALTPTEDADGYRKRARDALYERLGSYITPIVTNSCTSAMMLFGLHKPFRRYFVPALSWPSTWSWTPMDRRVVYDCNGVWNPNLPYDFEPEDLLILVDLYGRPMRIDKLLKVFKERNHGRPTILVDSAHTLLDPLHTEWLNKGLVDALAYSFGPIKQCSAVRGGALCLSYKHAGVWSQLLAMSDSGTVGRDGLYPVGWNFEMGEPNAALLCSQLETFKTRSERTHEILRVYRSTLVENESPDTLFGDSGHLAVMACTTPANATLLRHIMWHYNVKTGWHYPLARYLSPLQFPDAWDLSSRIVTIPCWAGMKGSQLSIVRDALGEYIRRSRRSDPIPEPAAK